MGVLTHEQQDLLISYRYLQELPTHELMASPDNPLFRLELNTPRVRTWRKLPHSWQQHQHSFGPEGEQLHYMQNEPENERQEVVSGYLG